MAGIMTGLAIAGATSQLIGAGMSFADARRQKKIRDDAERRAEEAMASARKSLEKNYMDTLAIQKEPYELEREAALVAGAQATEALRESDRGMGRVGAVYGQQQQAQRQIASAMGQEMFNLDYLSAQEDTRLRDINTQLDLGEATGAQLEAANAEERRAQQLQAGVQGVGNAAMTGIQGVPLYRNSGQPSPAKVDTSSLSGNATQNALNSMKSPYETTFDPTFTDRRTLPNVSTGSRTAQIIADIERKILDDIYSQMTPGKTDVVVDYSSPYTLPIVK